MESESDHGSERKYMEGPGRKGNSSMQSLKDDDSPKSNTSQLNRLLIREEEGAGKLNFDFNEAKEQSIMEKLHWANDCIEEGDLEAALSQFNKILFYDKRIPEVYAERAEIYVKLCDFSSAIANFKKALSLKYLSEWESKLN